MQFIQVAHSELIETCLRFLFDEHAKVVFSVFTLLDLGLENFLELMYFVEGLCVARLVALPLLESLLLDLLLDGDIVIFEASQRRLQLNRPFLGVLNGWRDESITRSHHCSRHHHLVLI